MIFVIHVLKLFVFSSTVEASCMYVPYYFPSALHVFYFYYQRTVDRKHQAEEGD